MNNDLEELEDEFLIMYDTTELAKILVKKVNFKDLCNVIDEL